MLSNLKNCIKIKQICHNISCLHYSKEPKIERINLVRNAIVLLWHDQSMVLPNEANLVLNCLYQIMHTGKARLIF